MGSRPSTDKGSNVFGVAVIAAAIGAIAGILMAPKSGDETRAELRSRYADMKQKSTQKAETARQKVHEGVETARDKVHDLTDKSRTKLNQTADKLDTKADQAAAQAHAKTEEAAARTRTRSGL